MDPYVTNIVCKYTLGCSIKTDYLTKSGNFSGFIIKDGKITARVYANGNCILTGFTDLDIGDAFLKRLFPNNPIKCRIITNISACATFPLTLSFYKLLKWSSDNFPYTPFVYEGELFPAIYWTGQPETVYFFTSGKTILTGFKSIERINIVWNEFKGYMEKMSIDLAKNN